MTHVYERNKLAHPVHVLLNLKKQKHKTQILLIQLSNKENNSSLRFLLKMRLVAKVKRAFEGSI